MAMKTEQDGKHPASHYLVVEDPNSPSTWHLLVRKANGELDHIRMGAAWAALHGGYRGNKYEGPDKQKAISKLSRLYAQEDRKPPSEATHYGFGSDVEDVVLSHFGVKGMKWGVRRKKTPSGDYVTVKNLRKKSIKELSNSELKKVVERVNLEKQYKAATTSPAKKAFSKALSSHGKQLMNQALQSAAKKAGEIIIKAAVAKAAEAAAGRSGREAANTVVDSYFLED